MSAELRSEINQRILTALREHPTLEKSYKKVLYKGRNKAEETVTKIFKIRGAVLYSVSQVVIGCLAGCVLSLCAFFFSHSPQLR